MLRYKKFLFLLLPFFLMSGSLALSNDDVVWQKEVQTPAVVKFSPDDKYVAYLYLDPNMVPDPKKNFVAVIDVETAEEIFRYNSLRGFDFFDNQRIVLHFGYKLKIVNFLTNEIEMSVQLPFSVIGFDFFKKENKAVFWSRAMMSFQGSEKQLKYFEYDFTTNEIGEVKNLDAIVTKDSLHYEFDYTVEIQFMRYTYNNNFLISLHIILDDSGKPGYERVYDYTYLFNPKENKYFVKKPLALIEHFQCNISNNRKYVTKGNFAHEDNNAIRIYSIEDTLKLTKQIKWEKTGYAVLDYSEEDDFLVSSIMNNLLIWDLADTEKPLCQYPYSLIYPDRIENVAVSHNNEYIIISKDREKWATLILLKAYFNPSSISDDENDIKIQIVPNPAQNTINISAFFDNPKNIKIRINDVTGNEIYQEEIGIVAGDFNHSIDAGIFPVGTYFLQLQTHNNVISEKFVIER